MTTGLFTICVACARFRPGTETEPPTCEAFPAEIPSEILYGGFDHRAPFPGDGGVRFELAPGLDELLADYEDAAN